MLLVLNENVATITKQDLQLILALI
jgi:hypothetical protein